MEQYKKEKSRIEREGKKEHGNIKEKGENFYRDKKKLKYIKMLKGGKAVRNSSGKIIKSDGKLAKENEEGELLIKTIANASGYLDDENAYVSSFVR